MASMHARCDESFNSPTMIAVISLKTDTFHQNHRSKVGIVSEAVTAASQRQAFRWYLKTDLSGHSGKNQYGNSPGHSLRSRRERYSEAWDLVVNDRNGPPWYSSTRSGSLPSKKSGHPGR